ncbi:hypothetical protein HPULCUR_000389 [Helicostylum pulchrum]|uniref:F-box domain-containing protein n=1 Tax=Helicostylum pulchrum TaxID=562976 RepID=A0ABP9XLR5_9FUNG
MLRTSRNKRLPFEILKLVFRNLDEKEDCKTCLLVCRSWNSAAHEYFSRDISIKVKQAKLGDLLDDISYFGQNVKVIKLTAYRYTIIDELKWKHILNLCPFLTSVYFRNKCNSSALLKALQDLDIRLNDLQKLDINNLTRYSLDIYDLYLRVSIQYCQTISSLQLYALDEEPVATKYGGLYEFISQFPLLTCLKITWCPSRGDNLRRLFQVEDDPKSMVDLKNVLEEAPRLKEVKLYGCAVAVNDSQDIDAVQLIENRSLTDLKIFADNISIRTLRYIVSLLKEVKILALLIENITMDEDISVEESETILGDLEASTSEMKRVEIQYKCNGHDFYLNMGKEFETERRLKGNYINENYFSSDDNNSIDDTVDYSPRCYNRNYNDDNYSDYNYEYHDDSDCDCYHDDCSYDYRWRDYIDDNELFYDD